MDELAFSATLGCLVLLALSYVWLFRFDHFRRKLAKGKVEADKLAIVLIASGSNLQNNLPAELESNGFVVYQIEVANQIGGQDNCEQEQEQRAKLKKEEAIEKQLKFKCILEESSLKCLANLLGQQFELGGHQLHALVVDLRRDTKSSATGRLFVAATASKELANLVKTLSESNNNKREIRIVFLNDANSPANSLKQAALSKSKLIEIVDCPTKATWCDYLRRLVGGGGGKALVPSPEAALKARQQAEDEALDCVLSENVRNKSIVVGAN